MTVKSYGNTPPRRDPGVIGVMCCDTVNRGLAYGDGKLFLYIRRRDAGRARRQKRQRRMDGEGWRSHAGRNRRHHALVVKDKVIVGNPAVEFGARGKITAYAAKKTEKGSGAILDRAGRRHARFIRKDPHARHAGRAQFQPEILEG